MIPSGWQTVKLSDLGEVNRGRSRHRPRHDQILYGGKYPFIQTADVKESGGRITKHKQTYNERGLSQSRLWPIGTMCITIAANIAETGILTFPACFPDSVIGFIADEDRCDVQFIEYVFRKLRRQIQHAASDSGTVQDNINLAVLEQLKFSIPGSVREQRAIARILGVLDDKIELNQRINRTLEAMAQAIFRSWFVDFEPVSAKRDGRKPVGMDDTTASLFPEHFQEIDMGPIPAGWRQGKVGEEFNLTMGQSPPGTTYNEDRDGLPFYQGRTDFGYRYPTRRIYCTAPTRFAEHGDTLVSVRAPVGDINLANERCCIGRGVAAVRHKSGDRSFTYYMMQSLSEEFAAFEGDGTLFGAINKDGFHGIKMIVPSPEVLSAFTRIVAPMDAKIEVADHQIQRLSALRDTLLPQLLSGELRVGQAEKMIEGVS